MTRPARGVGRGRRLGRLPRRRRGSRRARRGGPSGPPPRPGGRRVGGARDLAGRPWQPAAARRAPRARLGAGQALARAQPRRSRRRLRHALRRGGEGRGIGDVAQLSVVGIQLALVGGHAVAERPSPRPRRGVRLCGELLVELGAASDDALLGLVLDPLLLGVRPLADAGDVGLGARSQLLAAPLGCRPRALRTCSSDFVRRSERPAWRVSSATRRMASTRSRMKPADVSAGAGGSATAPRPVACAGAAPVGSGWTSAVAVVPRLTRVAWRQRRWRHRGGVCGAGRRGVDVWRRQEVRRGLGHRCGGRVRRALLGRGFSRSASAASASVAHGSRKPGSTLIRGHRLVAPSPCRPPAQGRWCGRSTS